MVTLLILVSAHSPNIFRMSTEVNRIKMNPFCFGLPELFVETVSLNISQYSSELSVSQIQPIEAGPQEPLLPHVIPFFSHITKLCYSAKK